MLHSEFWITSTHQAVWGSKIPKLSKANEFTKTSGDQKNISASWTHHVDSCLPNPGMCHLGTYETGCLQDVQLRLSEGLGEANHNRHPQGDGQTKPEVLHSHYLSSWMECEPSRAPQKKKDQRINSVSNWDCWAKRLITTKAQQTELPGELHQFFFAGRKYMSRSVPLQVAETKAAAATLEHTSIHTFSHLALDGVGNMLEPKIWAWRHRSVASNSNPCINSPYRMMDCWHIHGCGMPEPLHQSGIFAEQLLRAQHDTSEHPTKETWMAYRTSTELQIPDMTLDFDSEAVCGQCPAAT